VGPTAVEYAVMLALIGLFGRQGNDRLGSRVAFLAMSGIDRSRRPILFFQSWAFFFVALDVRFHVRIKGQDVLWAEPI